MNNRLIGTFISASFFILISAFDAAYNLEIEIFNFLILSNIFFLLLQHILNKKITFELFFISFIILFIFTKPIAGFLTGDSTKYLKIVLFNSGKLKRDYVYVEDAADSIILSLKKIDKYKFDVFNIGSGFPKTNLKITKTIVRYLDSKSKVEVIKNKNKNFNQDIFMNISKAKKKLEFKPKKLVNNLKKIGFKK